MRQSNCLYIHAIYIARLESECQKSLKYISQSNNCKISATAQECLSWISRSYTIPTPQICAPLVCAVKTTDNVFFPIAIGLESCVRSLHSQIFFLSIQVSLCTFENMCSKHKVHCRIGLQQVQPLAEADGFTRQTFGILVPQKLPDLPEVTCAIDSQRAITVKLKFEYVAFVDLTSNQESLAKTYHNFLMHRPVVSYLHPSVYFALHQCLHTRSSSIWSSEAKGGAINPYVTSVGIHILCHWQSSRATILTLLWLHVWATGTITLRSWSRTELEVSN